MDVRVLVISMWLFTRKKTGSVGKFRVVRGHRV